MKKWIFIAISFLLAIAIFGVNLTHLEWSTPENAVVVSAIITVLMVAAMDRSRFVWVSFLTLALVTYILIGVLPKEEVSFFYAIAAGQWILLGYILHRSLASPMLKLGFCFTLPILLLPFILDKSNWFKKDVLEAGVVAANACLAVAGLFLPLPSGERKDQGWNILALQHMILRFGAVYANLVLIDSSTRTRIAGQLAWPIVAAALIIFLIGIFRNTSYWDRATMAIYTLFILALTLVMVDQDLLIVMTFVIAASAFNITPANTVEGGGWNVVLKPLESGALGGITFVLASECCLQLISLQEAAYGLAWLSLILLMAIVIWMRAVGRLSLSRLIFERRQLLQPRPLLHLLLLLLAAAAAIGSYHV